MQQDVLEEKMMPVNSQNRFKHLHLSDGTPIDSLIDRSRREVSMRVFSDPEIYRLELERIWAKSWVVLGHESEIPNTGDFVTRRFGEDLVVLVRQRDGKIACLLNACAHRGAVVCREEAGNCAVLRCIYHGWIYNLDGSFRGAPFKDDMFPGAAPSQMGLQKARVEICAGIIFANWDETAPSLDDFLGDFKFYLELMFDRTVHGMEVIGPPQRFVINANWKTAAEQFAGDTYHAGQLHQSLIKMIQADPSNPYAMFMYTPTVSTANGHGILCFDLNGLFHHISGGKELSLDEKLAILPPAGVPREMVPELRKRFSEEDLNFLMTTQPGNGMMFPSTGIWNMNNPYPDGSFTPFLSFRTHHPVGLDKFEFCMWSLVAKGASDEYREIVQKTTSFSQGAAGYLESDDSEVWPGLMATSRGYITQKANKMKYWGRTGDIRPEGWRGGGEVHGGFARDDNQWNWWNVYFDRLTAES